MKLTTQSLIRSAAVVVLIALGGIGVAPASAGYVERFKELYEKNYMKNCMDGYYRNASQILASENEFKKIRKI